MDTRYLALATVLLLAPCSGHVADSPAAASNIPSPEAPALSFDFKDLMVWTSLHDLLVDTGHLGLPSNPKAELTLELRGDVLVRFVEASKQKSSCKPERRTLTVPDQDRAELVVLLTDDTPVKNEDPRHSVSLLETIPVFAISAKGPSGLTLRIEIDPIQDVIQAFEGERELLELHHPALVARFRDFCLKQFPDPELREAMVRLHNNLYPPAISSVPTTAKPAITTER